MMMSVQLVVVREHRSLTCVCDMVDRCTVWYSLCVCGGGGGLVCLLAYMYVHADMIICSPDEIMLHKQTGVHIWGRGGAGVCVCLHMYIQCYNVFE